MACPTDFFLLLGHLYAFDVEFVSIGFTGDDHLVAQMFLNLVGVDLVNFVANYSYRGCAAFNATRDTFCIHVCCVLGATLGIANVSVELLCESAEAE
jgi:hypothetical protein